MDIGTLVGYLELDTEKWDGPLQKVGQRMPGWMAAAGATAAVAAGAAFAAAFANAVDVEAVNDRLAAQLGLTEEEARRAGEAAAGAYGNAFGESREAVQEATAGVISSIRGMREASVDELQGITEKVLTLSDGFKIEADRISQVVGQMLSTGLAASAEEGLDLLTASLQKVPAAVREDVLDAVDEYGGFFAQIGLSGEEAMGALVAASEKGMFGIDKTGDALKEFTIRATDMSTSSVAAYEALGLSADDMAAKILAGGDAGAEGFQQIVDGLLSMEDPVARSQAAIALFGTPLEDLGTNEIPAFLQGLSDMSGGLGEFEGAAQSMADTAGDNVATKWEEVRRTFENVVTTIAGQLLPAVMPLLEWAAQNPALLTAVAIAVGVLAAAFGVLAVAQWAVNTAMFASPLTWIILGIVALIAALVLLVANWDAVVAWISEVWSGFVSWLQGVMEGLAAWWNEMWAGFGSWVQEVWSGFIGWISDTWSGFVAWLQSVGDGIASWWNGLWAGIGAWIQSVWQGFIGWVQGIASGFVSFLMSAFSGYVSFWAGIWNGVRDTIVNVWNGIVSWFQGIPGAIRDVFSGAASWLVSAGRDIVNGLWNGIRAIWDNLTGWFNDVAGGLIDGVKGIFGIASPSKVFRGIGNDIGRGLIQGLEEMEPRVEVAMGDMARLPDTAGEFLARYPVGESKGSTTFVYNAAENQSLSDEESLFAALGSPRSPFGGV